MLKGITDPMKGAYKRDYEGDFLCTEEVVRAMFADQRDVSGDVEVLDEFGLDVLNQNTIKGYKSKTGARKLLDKMIIKGLIKKAGKGSATKYVI